MGLLNIGNGVGFVGKYFEKVELGGGVILLKVVGIDGAIELLVECFVFDDVFGYFVGILSYYGFRANTPGNGGMVTEVLDVKFCGVIVGSGFVSARGVN